MADYVLSAKGTYDGSNMDGGLDKSASKLNDLKDTAKSVGSQVAGFFATSFVSVGKSITTAIGTVTAGVTTLAATGGMSRALNIEKAQAMFKGMKLEWGDFYQTIQDSVDGTAFGFDTAATAAAQLAASGVAAGSDMEKALNGCVGAAATFSQDLGDLSSIWAKVAANGKLSGEQVAQFTDRGINAISVLSTYLGKSSDEISKMVTAGKIDFQTFSDAMYASFGDSAKAANESFTGSMANMKAALSKIGQDWMTPLKDSAIPVFNSIRGVLNSCRAAIKPLSTAFGEFLGVTYDAQGNLTRTGGAVEKLCTFLDGLSEKIKGVDLSQLGTGGKIAAAALAGLAAVSLGGLIGQIPVLGALANSLTGGIIPAINGVATGFAALSAPAAVAVAAITAFAAIFAYSMATNEAFRNQIIGIASSIASSLAPAFQSLTGLAEPLQGLFAAAVIIVNSFALALGGLVAAVAPVIATIVSGLVPIISTIIDAVGQIALVITTTLCPIIQQVTDLITANMPVIQEVITGVLTVIQTIISTVLPVMVEIFSSTMAAIQAVIDAVWPYISAIVTAAMNAIQAIVTIVLGIINQDWGSVWNGIQALASSVWIIIENIVNGGVVFIQAVITNGLALIQSVWNSIWSAIGDLVANLWNTIKSVVQGGINNVKSFISSGLSTVQGLWNSAWSTVQSILNNAWSGITNGVSSGINSVVSFVSSIPGRIVGALGNLGSLLYSAGRSIVSGLLNGIKSTIGGVYDFVSGIAGTIASLKGPKRKDLRLLIPNGGWIMQSLETGLKKRFEGVKDTVSGFADELSMSFGGPDVTYETGAAAAVGAVAGGDTYYMTIDGNTADADIAVANAIDVLVSAAHRSSTARR